MTPGIYHFKGIRSTPSKKFIVSLDTYVEIRIDRAYPELMVAMFGTGKLYPISSFEGEWELVYGKEGSS